MGEQIDPHIPTVNDEVIFTISAVEFTIDSTDAENAITGFDIVYVE